MLHRTRREVAICCALLTGVVSITLYLNIFTLHGSKSHLKSRLSGVYLETHVISVDKVPIYRLITGAPGASSNFTIKYGPDHSLPFNAGEVFTDEQRQYHKRGTWHHAFNVLISDRIGPVARPIPDTRHSICRKKTYSNISISASVIICFHKEAFSTLLRTVASVIERTPPQLLQEVILVDDYSHDEDENVKLMMYLEHNYPYGKVSVIHSPTRLGLIGARVIGAKAASGDVLVFLDSHCEPNVGWIEPLLDLIQKDRTVVVCPVVDIINSNTMAYVASPVLRGGFNWGLHFRWEALPNEMKDPSESFPSPTMAGGLFAVNRLYFKDIGLYDEEMKEWGGENLELSFRIWMCGGKLLIAPCSRVGHIFRNRRPNAIEGEDNPTRNAARVAAVWMDEYGESFYKQRRISKSMDFGDVSARIQLREQLKCRSFKWFLETIYPEISIPGTRVTKVKYYRPPTDEKFREVARGAIKVSGLDLCLQSDETKDSLVIAKKCTRGSTSQLWRFSAMGEIKFGTDSRLCIDASSSQNLHLLKCRAEEGPQTWKLFPAAHSADHDEKITGRLYSISEGLCMQLAGGDLTDKYEIIMQICSSPSVHTFNVEPL